MASKRKTDFSPHIPLEKAPRCSVPGCCEPGGYKAPTSRESLHEYQWFCLEHVRDHNAKWDYFAGLGPNEIEEFMKESVTGHRPTWTREGQLKQQYFKLHAALNDFLNLNGSGFREKATPPLSGKLRKALGTLELEYPYTEKELKSQYRLLVKKHHPDVNKGDKTSEERFKQITVAYTLLAEHLDRV